MGDAATTSGIWLTAAMTDRLTVCPVCRSLIDDRKLLSGGASGERPTKEEREKEGEDAMMEICA